MYIKTKRAEHTEQLGTSTLGIVFATVAHLNRFMQSETIMCCMIIFFVKVLGPVLGGG